MDVLVYGFGADINNIGGQSYIIIGATAMLAAYCRLTYSLAVIMLETTQSINNFLPTLLSIGVSLGVAKACNRSLYDYAIRAKQMPLLRNHMPEENRHIRVKELLDRNPQQIEVVESVCQVERLAEVCTMGFSSIPVVNMAGRIIGVIPRDFVIVLIENHIWYEQEVKERVGSGNAPVERALSQYYRTAMTRQESARLSDAALSQNDDEDFSPKGSISGDKSPFVMEDKKLNRVEDRDDKMSDSIQKDTPQNSYEKDSEIEEQKLTYSVDGNERFEPVEKDDRNETMMKFTGEKDYEVAPASENLVHWHKFCSNFYSKDRDFADVADIA